jgi:hypothetical protein
MAIPGPSDFNPSSSDMAGEATAKSTDANRLDNPNITLCFSGGNDQYGTIVLGGPGGQRLATHIQYFNNKPSYC